MAVFTVNFEEILGIAQARRNRAVQRDENARLRAAAAWRRSWTEHVVRPGNIF